MTSTNYLTCEAEPIRTPGAIQPHGVLLVLTGDADLTVVAISENVGVFIGCPPAAALGQPARKLLGEAAIAVLAATQQDAKPRQFLCEIAGKHFDCLACAGADGRLCIDMELASFDGNASCPMLQNALQGMEALRTLTEVTAIAHAATRLVQTITGFDRVMVYRFDADWNGAVIAEACADRVEPYLGLHFPASDIPSQARELYLTNKVRQIPDTLYQPIALLGAAPGTVDLSQSALRSVSPIHIEYMKTMGTRASLVGSLIIGGRLWGLIACHHLRDTKCLSRHARDIFAWICADLSSQLAAVQSQRLLEDKTCRAEKRQRLLATMYESGFAGLLAGTARDDLLSILAADGFSLVTAARISTIGRTPALARIEEIQAKRCEIAGTRSSFHSHALSSDLGLAVGDGAIAGALFLSLQHRPDVTMIWFRTEREHSVFWGGNPDHPHEFDNRQRISPRRSFAAFRQVIHGQSLPWSKEDVEAAEYLGALIEIEVQRDFEHRLDRSETIYRTVVNAMTEGIVAQSAFGEIITCNPRAEQILGLSADQMVGRTSLDPRWRAIREDGREFSGAEHPSMVTLRTGQPCQNVIMGVHKPDGSLIWISINTEPLVLEGSTGLHGVVATFLDITERKRLQSEDLAARIIAAQEQERARLSHDLHDEVGQTLTALKINLSRAQQGCANATARHCFDQAQEITERLMGDVRSLAHQLRPTELDELGLVAALRSHLDKVIRPLGLVVTLQENIREQRLPPELELCCFRVIQEALTNCVRHAQATQIEVMVALASGQLNFSVRDNGQGFVVGQLLSGAASVNSLGLVGMRERVAAIGGQIFIASTLGQGTEVRVSCVIKGTPS
jgi:PAS domain S-box-containing protein